MLGCISYTAVETGFGHLSVVLRDSYVTRPSLGDEHYNISAISSEKADEEEEDDDEDDDDEEEEEEESEDEDDEEDDEEEEMEGEKQEGEEKEGEEKVGVGFKATKGGEALKAD